MTLRGHVVLFWPYFQVLATFIKQVLWTLQFIWMRLCLNEGSELPPPHQEEQWEGLRTFSQDRTHMGTQSLTSALLLDYGPEEVVEERRDFMHIIQKQSQRGHPKKGGVSCALSCSKGKTGQQWKWLGLSIWMSSLFVKGLQPGQCEPWEQEQWSPCGFSGKGAAITAAHQEQVRETDRGGAHFRWGLDQSHLRVQWDQSRLRCLAKLKFYSSMKIEFLPFN